jgi:glycosyltransferase involved in cell wall biosynthesis
VGIKYASGRYIAFLDSDDMWLPNKLEVQMKAFQENIDAAIVYSYYEKVTETGVRSGRIVASPPRITYDDLLYGNIIGCLTGLYDTEKVGKVYMNQIGHEDYAMWLEILKKGFVGVNTCDVQALYRVREGSVSADKFKAARWQWNIYRNVEHLALFKAIRCFIAYAYKGLVKIMK